MALYAFILAIVLNLNILSDVPTQENINSSYNYEPEKQNANTSN